MEQTLQDGFVPVATEKPAPTLYTPKQILALALLIGPLGVGWAYFVNYRRLDRAPSAWLALAIGTLGTVFLFVIATVAEKSGVNSTHFIGHALSASCFQHAKLAFTDIGRPHSNWRVVGVMLGSVAAVMAPIMAVAFLPPSAVSDFMLDQAHDARGHVVELGKNTSVAMGEHVLATLDAGEYFSEEGVPAVTVDGTQVDFAVNDRAYENHAAQTWAVALARLPGFAGYTLRLCADDGRCAAVSR